MTFQEQIERSLPQCKCKGAMSFENRLKDLKERLRSGKPVKDVKMSCCKANHLSKQFSIGSRRASLKYEFESNYTENPRKHISKTSDFASD